MIYNYEYNGKFCSETKYVVYLITNTVSNKFYIGQTRRELRKRWADYRIDLLKPIIVKKRNGCNIHLRRSVQREYNKVGNTDFLIFSILEIVDKDNALNVEQKQKLLNEREIYWIENYRSIKGINNVYNIKDGGQETKNTFSKDPENTRKKLSIARKKFLASKAGQELIAEISKKMKGKESPLKGRTISELHREKIKQATQGCKNPNYGKTHTEETKKKIGEKNRQLTEETRNARSNALKGKIPFNKNKKWNELYKSETIVKMKQTIANSNKSRNISEETREKFRLKNTGKCWGKHSAAQKEKWSKERKNVSFEGRYGTEKAKAIKEKLKISTKGRNLKRFDMSNNPLMSPQGDTYVEIIGLYDFCKNHNLHHRLLKKVIFGELKSHKGWHLKNES
jgi:group I intron endonuclease